ncbi:uncharacterized protein LOC143159165 [Aptenodytes patagonicus]|uniref:uncharacterized protein LOC143159165 n=1 Tax=Aptenodytes patagonicus TaxID=9234 RepID=UPI003F9F7CC3
MRGERESPSSVPGGRWRTAVLRWPTKLVNKEERTPLHLACANGHADVVRFLAGKKCQLNPRDNSKKSPLMKAVEHQHKDCVAILLEHGANPDLRGAGGNTALHLAAAIPSKSLVELLLEHNAHIDAQNKMGYTPLAVAITEHCEEMVEFLLQKGADVHARDRHKRTTLMVAVAAGDVNVIRLLLRHGAELSHEDEFGRTALSYARLSGYADIYNQWEEFVNCERTGECSAGSTEGPAVLDSSCSGTTADVPLGAPAMTGAGVLPAGGAEQEEDDDSPFDSETDSEGPRKGPAGVLLPAADRHGACVQSVAEARGNGVLPAAGAEQEEDDDSPFDSETDSEGPRKGPAGVLLPAADRHGACVQSVAEARGNGVLPVGGAEQEEDDDSPFDSETDSEGPRKGPAGVLLPAADRHGACVQSVAEARGNGVLPVGGAEQEEDDDSPFDSETDSEGPRKGPAGVLLPAADRHGACVQSVAEARGNGVLPVGGAEQLEDFDSSSENEVLSLPELAQVTALGREEHQLKKDASTQADCQGDRQRWVRQLQQGLADALKKNSLAEASLEAKKRYSRDLQEQKLQLQKELDRSKAKLQELKERRTQTECYAESLKNAIKNKKRELTTSRKMQGLLVTSSRTAAIPELKERMQRLQVGKARLEATAQQQAKTIEALEKVLQASASARKGLEDLITGFQTTRTAKEHQHWQAVCCGLERGLWLRAARGDWTWEIRVIFFVENTVCTCCICIPFLCSACDVSFLFGKRGSESKEVKKLAKMKCRSEALLDEMRGRNVALEEECTRLKMLLEGLRTKLMAYAGRKRESQLSSRGEMENSCSEVANEVGKQRRKQVTNAVSTDPHLTDCHRTGDAVKKTHAAGKIKPGPARTVVHSAWDSGRTRAEPGLNPRSRWETSMVGHSQLQQSKRETGERAGQEIRQKPQEVDPYVHVTQFSTCVCSPKASQLNLQHG